MQSQTASGIGPDQDATEGMLEGAAGAPIRLVARLGLGVEQIAERLAGGEVAFRTFRDSQKSTQ